MAAVECPSCGRFNLSDKLDADGRRCKFCQTSVPIPAPAVNAPPADPGPPAVDVTLVEAGDDGWWRLPGLFVISAGTGLMFLGAMTALAGIQVGGKGASFATVVLFFVFGSIVGLVGRQVYRVGTRMVAPSADRAEATDARPPVLLLRRFQDDDLGFGHRPTTDPIATYMPDERLTFEELVAEAVAVAGPVVAIGDPAEGLPKLGAARAYVGHDAWQTRVQEYLDRAGVVVMLMSRIEGEHGLAWELRTVWSTVPPDRVVFVLPPVGEDEARRRWTAFHDRSDGRLPPYQGGELAAGFGADGACQVARGEGDRIALGAPYAAAVAGFARAAVARRTAALTEDVILEVVPPAPTALGRLRRRFPLGSGRTVLVLFAALLLSYVLAYLLGWLARTFDWQPPRWLLYPALAVAIAWAITASVTMLALLAALERAHERFTPTNFLVGLLSLGVFAPWAGVGVLAVSFARTVATGPPGEPRVEGKSEVPDVRPVELIDVDKLFDASRFERAGRATFDIGTDDRKSGWVTIPDAVVDRMQLGSRDAVSVRVERFIGRDAAPESDADWQVLYAAEHDMRSGRRLDLREWFLGRPELAAPENRLRILIARR